MCIRDRINITSDIDDTLAVSIFNCFEHNPGQIKFLNLSSRILERSGEDVSYALEKMVKRNRSLECLVLNHSVSDSMALAVAKGLVGNHTLQRVDINIIHLNDDVLNQLLQSLCCSPLTVVCKQADEQILSL